MNKDKIEDVFVKYIPEAFWRYSDDWYDYSREGFELSINFGEILRILFNSGKPFISITITTSSHGSNLAKVQDVYEGNLPVDDNGVDYDFLGKILKYRKNFK